jgi:hypothetical protein
VDKNTDLLLLLLYAIIIHEIIIIIIIIIFFVCLLSALMCLPPVLSSNLTFTLCCVCPLCNYLYLQCAESVIGLVAVGSAHI